MPVRAAMIGFVHRFLSTKLKRRGSTQSFILNTYGSLRLDSDSVWSIFVILKFHFKLQRASDSETFELHNKSKTKQRMPIIQLHLSALSSPV